MLIERGLNEGARVIRRRDSIQPGKPFAQVSAGGIGEREEFFGVAQLDHAEGGLVVDSVFEHGSLRYFKPSRF